MTFTVKPSTARPSTADVEITGLQPGEMVILQFVAQMDGRRQEAEVRPATGAQPDGSFQDSIGLIFPTPDESATLVTWQAKVIHARGVACTSVALPTTTLAATATPP